MKSRKKIAFFVGNDLTAHLVLNGVIKDIHDNRRENYEPVVFLPEHKASLKASLPELREYAFHERGLLNNVVFPYVDESPKMGAKNLSPKWLSDKYDIKVSRVEDVNDPDFIHTLIQQEAFSGAVSIRCFQIFKEPIIQHFNQNGFFLNAHPGLLPKYRGVMSTVRALAENEANHGWTLHHVDKGIDTGDILWVRAKSSQELDLEKPAVLVTADLAPLGVNAIKMALDTLDADNALAGHPQDSSKGHYYTYPTKNELKVWAARPLKLVDSGAITKRLVQEFSVAGSNHAAELQGRIEDALDSWERTNTPTPASHRHKNGGAVRSIPATQELGGMSRLLGTAAAFAAKPQVA